MNISSIKAGTELGDKFSYYENERKFRFHYDWRAIDTALVRLIALKISHQNHSHPMISFSNLHHMYSLVHISSIKAGREMVAYFLWRRIDQIFQFCYHWKATDTALV